MNTKIFAGLEEIFARLFSALLVIAVLVIVTVARESVTLEWLPVAGWLVLFWFAYELMSIILFNFFTFFSSRNQPVSVEQPSPVDLASTDTPTITSDSHNL